MRFELHFCRGRAICRTLGLLAILATALGLAEATLAAEPAVESPTMPAASQAADSTTMPATTDSPQKPADQSPVVWHTDYSQAMDLAKAEKKMLLLCFHGTGNDCICDRFRAETQTNQEICRRLQDYVCVSLPLAAKIKMQGKETVLLQHPSFSEMLGRPGVAILDFAHTDAFYYGSVVSTLPLTGQRWYTSEQMSVILDLPPGTLTQRTLIYVVRTHPEKPASTKGRLDPNLAKEAESHSQYQARIRLQGHHNWGMRFQRINARLPGGELAREVCAESWPGQRLLEAAIDCVACWRSSSGHWSAVRSAHGYYGYDMKRGSNGIWYATGIFGG